jgi:hypothetical protein
MLVNNYPLYFIIFIVFLFVSSLTFGNSLDDVHASSAKKELKELGNEAKRTAEKGAEKLEELSEKIRSGLNSNNLKDINSNDINGNGDSSIADELLKLAKLKEEGIITEQEFNQMKQNLIKNK